jgi:AcrR family transcriptional regulator
LPRFVKEDEYAIRRNQIIDTTLKFVYTKGYGQITIQDILDDLHISKGAFYHYFDSKTSVLEALVERMIGEMEPLLRSIVNDTSSSALEKLQRYYATAVRWKTEQKEIFFELIRIWYADENIIVRQKLTAKSLERITPLLTEIIQQGVDEGVFNTAYPEFISQVNLYLLQGLSDAFVELLFAPEVDPAALQRSVALFAAYNDALVRILGAPKNSIQLMDQDTLADWFSYRTRGAGLQG